MSPLQRIAMGMVIVVGTARFPPDPSPPWASYDALPDPIGWLLVGWGVFALARVNPAFEASRWPALLAGVVSVPMWFPQLHHQLDPSGEWFASLPQIAFCLLLAREIGVTGMGQQPPDRFVTQRFGVLVWGFALTAVLPVLAIGGGMKSLETPTLVVATLTSVGFVYYLFRVHRREWLGGAGPLQVRRAPR